MEYSELSQEEVARYCDKSAHLRADHVREGPDACCEYLNSPIFLEFVGNLDGKTGLTKIGFALKAIEKPCPSREMCEKYPWFQRLRERAAMDRYVLAAKPSNSLANDSGRL